MPVYEYQCDKCGHTTESIRAMRDADEAIACESCGSKKTHRAHSVFSAATSQPSGGLPMTGCGRCGDPRGSCGMN
jgi:putative FmdB family regulatory protein